MSACAIKHGQQSTLTQKINDAARVTPLIVVPRDKLDKVLVERDTGLRIEDGRMWVTIQVRRYNVILRVSQNA